VHTYAVTPFRTDDLLAVDREGLARNLEFLVDRGVRVIAVCGGTGEHEALSEAEFVAVAETAVKVVAGRALVIGTVPGNVALGTRLLRDYERLGVDVGLLMPPLIRGRVPADLEGVAEYVATLAGRTSLPVMPYNTQRWPAEFFVRLAEIEGVIGIKDPCEDDQEMFRAIQVLGDRFVWIGNKRHDPGVVHLRYQMGMEGFTSGMTNFLSEPELLIHEAAVARDWDRVVALQALCAPLERARKASDDAAMVKASMDIVGLRGGRVRPPRLDVTPEAREVLRVEIERLQARMAELAPEALV
jgi:dihydrodipicolinate synthase/N-acetylneuraminate lyase